MNKAVEVLYLKATTAERQGNTGAARTIYQQIVSTYPREARARERLKRLAAPAEPPLSEIEALTEMVRAGQLAEVIARAGELLSIYPHSFPLHCFVGEAQARLECFDLAVTAYQSAVRANPSCGRTKGRLAHLLFKDRKLPEAIAMFGEALEVDPRNHLTLTGMGQVLTDMKRYPQAERAFRKALAIKPDHADAIVGAGNALISQFRSEDAVAFMRAALETVPATAEILNTLGTALYGVGDLDGAGAHYAKAQALHPDLPDVLTNQSFVLLTLGDYERGLELYEYRRTRSNPIGVLEFPAPSWTGQEDLAGKAVFLHSEQGLGDTIQFIRYAANVRDLGARVTVSVQSPLVALLADAIPGVEVVPEPPLDRGFDYYAALMSLPLLLGTRVDTIPAPVPYIHADPARVAKWADRLGRDGFRIGICWHGSYESQTGQRSFTPADLGPIAALDGVRLISLQKEDGRAEAHDIPDGIRIEELGDNFDPPGEAFLDTAAVMCHCDLVITCDTSVAHVAGALGVPTWLALKRLPDWRWMLDSGDTPWYPTMRLFRQDRQGDWDCVIARIRDALVERLARRRMETGATLA